MNSSGTKALVEDLFADQEAEQFRAAAMTFMVGAVRRKRRIRQAQRFSALALVLAGVSSVWLLHRPVPAPQPQIVSRPAPYEWVTTKTFAVERVVRTQVGNSTITSSQSNGYAVLESMDSRRFVRQLDDDGLLGLFAGRAVALVYHGPGEAELVFGR